MTETKSFEEAGPGHLNRIKRLRIHKYHEDLYQAAGLIALWEAYSNFDPEKGHFAAYTQKALRGRMLSALTEARKYEDRT